MYFKQGANNNNYEMCIVIMHYIWQLSLLIEQYVDKGVETGFAVLRSLKYTETRSPQTQLRIKRHLIVYAVLIKL
jgi:hypothetical protein